MLTPNAPPLSPEMHAAVRAQVLVASWLIAVRKNAPMGIAQSDAEIDSIVEALYWHGRVEKYLDDDRDAAYWVEGLIALGIDDRAIKPAVRSSARAQGITDDACDREVLSLWINEASTRLMKARPRTGRLYRWPNIEDGLATAFTDFGFPAVDLRRSMTT